MDKNKLQRLEDLNKNTILKQTKLANDPEELILFVSFDLVNSTKFKTYNYSNWFNVIFGITQEIRERIKNIDSNFQLWRSIGDEVVFTIVISDKQKLEKIIQQIFQTLNEIHLLIKDGSILINKPGISDKDRHELREQNILSVKSTAWLALVSKDLESNDLKYNLEYTYRVGDKIPVTEFQGNDIDTGFRISKKCTNPRRLTLSLELAYILSESEHIRSKLHIISYSKLKGIWDNRLYPVIWYHDEYVAGDTLQNSFFYDEEYEQELVKEYLINKKENYKNTNYNIYIMLKKIIHDRNLIFKLNKIKDKLGTENNKSSSKALQVPSEFIEVHCVAVCVNSKDEVFLAKRSMEDDDYPGYWEFGCCKMTVGLTFEQALKEKYSKSFNMNIKIKKPFRDYSFKREDNISIPGIRYIAEIVNEDEIEIQNNDYVDFKFVDINSFKDIKAENVIDFNEFQEIIIEVTGNK